jgi:hypothetical protein
MQSGGGDVRAARRQRASRDFADEGIVAKATGLVENSKPLRRRK